MVSLNNIKDKKMKLNILQVTEDVNKKSGEVKLVAVALGNFSNYGKIEPATVKLNLNEAQFKTLKTQIGKEVEIDIVVPLPQYPLQVVSVG